MKKALITGITGQDGSYMAELLLEKGYRVVGTTRGSDAPLFGERIEFVNWDMMDAADLSSILSEHRPDEFYNFAAYSSGSGMFDDPVGIGEINGLAVARILEAIRQVDPGIRFCQASSREIFGEAKESPQSEKTPANPRSPYGAAKHYADNMVRIYRAHHGIFAASAILFNHESPRRGTGFVTRKITREAAKIKAGLSSKVRLGNLETRRDWGFAGDYVRGMWMMMQQTEAQDFVFATGKTHTVREFCEAAFGCLDLDYREYVHEDSSAYRPSEPFELVGDASKAKHVLGWEPRKNFGELVEMMVEADLREIA